VRVACWEPEVTIETIERVDPRARARSLILLILVVPDLDVRVHTEDERRTD
jgi:hypothetical protein